jgi:penicillin-binding protein 1A
VLGRMQEDGVISPEQRAEALAAPPKIVALDRQRRDTGFHFVDFLGREAKADAIESLTAQPYTVHSTINATLQRDTEAALQEGLVHYEIENGRVQFHGPEANIADAVQKLSAGNHGGAPGAPADAAPGTTPAWQQALANVHLPLYDVHWEPAVILRSGKRGDEASASASVWPMAALCR